MTNKWFIMADSEHPVTEEAVADLRYNGAVGFSIKGGFGTKVDPSFYKHLEVMIKMGAPFIITFELAPQEDTQEQVKAVKKLQEESGTLGVVLEAKQWWRDVNAYRKVVVQGLPGYVAPIDANPLFKKYYDMITRIWTELVKVEDISIVGATNKLFVDNYARQVAAVINDKCNFFWNTTEFKFFEDEVEWKVFNDVVASETPPASLYPKGVRSWHMWNFSRGVPVSGYVNYLPVLIREDVADVLFGNGVEMPDVPEKYLVGTTEMTFETGELTSPVRIIKSEPVDATEGAHNLAEEHDIDIAKILGTGKDGRVLVADVQAYIDSLEEEDDDTDFA